MSEATKAATAAFVVEQCPNPQIRVFHTRTRRRTLAMDSCGPRIRGASSADRMLLKSIWAIRGVNYVSFTLYEVAVGKGDAFSWDEVMPGITAALENAAKAAGR